MNEDCLHLEDIRDVTPSALGCEECLKTGSAWVHLRLCRTCGHVGCCDDSPNRHATKHFQKTRHPIIEGYDPPEGWGWCYVDEVMIDLSDRATPQNGPIPRFLLDRTDWRRSTAAAEYDLQYIVADYALPAARWGHLETQRVRGIKVQAVEFGVEIGEYSGVVRVPRRVFQRLLPQRPTPERCVAAFFLQRARFESIAERKLHWRQLTEDGNVEISGRDLR